MQRFDEWFAKGDQTLFSRDPEQFRRNNTVKLYRQRSSVLFKLRALWVSRSLDLIDVENPYILADMPEIRLLASFTGYKLALKECSYKMLKIIASSSSASGLLLK